MPNATFFNTIPVADKKIGQYGKWFAPKGTFRNGYFQHLVCLGVHGYVVINNFNHKEILLVDTWPSYKRTPAGRRIPAATFSGYERYSDGNSRGWEFGW